MISPYIYIMPVIVMPIILMVHWMACSVPTITFIATNSVPDADESMVTCHFEFQLMSDMSVYIMNPVLDLLVCLLVA